MAALTPLLARYSLEVLVVVAAATAALPLVRVPPRVRLVLWRLVVFACLLLPFAPPRVLEVDAAPAPAVGAAISSSSTHPSSRTPAPLSDSPIHIIPWIILTGIVLRGAWLAIGLVRLRTLGRRSETAVLDDDLRALKQALAPAADVSWHADLQQPATFGVRRPIVLLPSRLRTAAPDLRRAVVCHELVHVDRGDWAATVAEECILTLFWFHPAMWWALSQIQLNREATVDARVVDIIGSRREYMEALLSFADASAPVMAPVFARRRHVIVRIRQLSQEVVMSRTRITVGAIAVAALVLGAGWTVVSAVPMRTEVHYRVTNDTNRTPAPRPWSVTAPQVSEEASPGATRVAAVRRGVQPPPPAQRGSPPPPPQDRRTNPRVIDSPTPDYPSEALRYSPGATVWVALSIGPSGNVIEAKATHWRLTIENSIEDPNYWASKPERAFIDAAEAAALKWKFAPPDANTRTRVEVAVTFRNIRTSADSQHPDDGTRRHEDRTRHEAVPDHHSPIVRVGGNIRQPLKIADVRPIYPDEALAAGIEGVVVMEVRVGTDGRVLDATVVRSIPELDDAALHAVRGWRYQPTLLNGQPVEVMITVTINFTLAEK